eukprot:645822-Prorocentrum_minimum.AAC.3
MEGIRRGSGGGQEGVRRADSRAQRRRTHVRSEGEFTRNGGGLTCGARVNSHATEADSRAERG